MALKIFDLFRPLSIAVLQGCSKMMLCMYITVLNGPFCIIHILDSITNKNVTNINWNLDIKMAETKSTIALNLSLGYDNSELWKVVKSLVKSHLLLHKVLTQ